MSDVRAFAFACETCGDAVDLTDSQYADQHNQPGWLSSRKWGARIICAECLNPTPKPVLVDAHPLDRRRPKQYNRRPREMPVTQKMNLKPNERDDYGATVTAREQTTRRTVVMVGHGRVNVALADVCARIDALDGDWKIVTVSTPATIFGDLQGMRDADSAPIESLMLGKVGRTDLVEVRA